MNRQEFNDWLKTHKACAAAVRWCAQHPDLSVQKLMTICPKGDWILWVYARAGYAPEVLAPVAYRAATRAMGYAADALDRAGVQHGLRGLVVTDAESARAANEAAERAANEAAEWAANEAAEWAALAAWAAEEAALSARAAARAAGDAGDAGAEHKLCADECRQLLPELRIEG